MPIVDRPLPLGCPRVSTCITGDIKVSSIGCTNANFLVWILYKTVIMGEAN